MNKRIFSMMLVLMIAFASFSCACAEAVPSVTVETVVTVAAATSSTGAVLPETFKVEVVPQSETATKVIAEITEAVKAAPVASYFGEEVIKAAVAKLPAAVAAKAEAPALVLNELTTVTVSEYDASYEDVVVSLALTAEYADNDAIVVLVGIMVDGVLTWVPMDATIVDGQVNVTFTQEVLSAAGDSEMLFALLRAE